MKSEIDTKKSESWTSRIGQDSTGHTVATAEDEMFEKRIDEKRKEKNEEKNTLHILFSRHTYFRCSVT